MHVVARIGKAHGLRGEVTVQLHTDTPQDRFVPGARFATQPSERGPLLLTGVRVHQGTYLLAFDGVSDRGSAETLRDTRLLVEQQEESQDDGDGWYEADLLGFAVTLADGTVVGTVTGLQLRPAQDLLEVELTAGGQALVPFVDALVPEVDEEGRRVVIDPPAGLLQLGD